MKKTQSKKKNYKVMYNELLIKYNKYKERVSKDKIKEWMQGYRVGLQKASILYKKS